MLIFLSAPLNTHSSAPYPLHDDAGLSCKEDIAFLRRRKEIAYIGVKSFYIRASSFTRSITLMSTDGRETWRRATGAFTRAYDTRWHARHHDGRFLPHVQHDGPVALVTRVLGHYG